MKLRLLILLFMLPSALFAQRAMRNSIDYLLKDKLLDVVDASVMVYDLDDDTLLYAHREHKFVRPASVQKIITTVVALDRLGADYMIDTELLVKESDGSCNLYVKGAMDPLFGVDDMARMAAAVQDCGTVDTLFADCSFSDSLYWGSGWIWDDNPYGFQPYLSPLMVCRGAVEVWVSPSSKGKAPHCRVNPESSFYSVVNEAVCGDSEQGKLTVLRDWLEDSNVIRIRGNCTKPYKERINMYKSADFFLALLAEKLDSVGVDVKVLSFGRTPDDARPVHIQRRAITDVVDEALMESDNLCAEALVYHLAAIGNSVPLSMDEGCEVLRSFLSNDLGVTDGFSIVDGSGLSVYDYLSADIIMNTLCYAYDNKGLFDAFYCRLPLSGVSGTMQNRTKDGVAYKKVRAKTGTVSGVCTVAGYAKAANGHMYAFVILNSGLQKSSVVRKWQDRVLEAICR